MRQDIASEAKSKIPSESEGTPKRKGSLRKGVATSPLATRNLHVVPTSVAWAPSQYSLRYSFTSSYLRIRVLGSFFALVVISAILFACNPGQESTQGNRPIVEIPGTQVLMDFSRRDSFYSAPFPSDDLRNTNGSVELSGFPNPDGIGFMEKVLDILRNDSNGFSLTSAVYFQMSGPPAANGLPDVQASVSPDSPLQLISVDPLSPDYLRRYPADTAFVEDGGPFGSPNLLSVLPLQGIPLRPRTAYAAVVLRSLLDAQGKRLGVSLSMARIAAGEKPDEMTREVFATYRSALAALPGAGIQTSEIAGLAVFTTGAPTVQMGTFREGVLARPLPVPNSDFALNEIFEDYCVYETTIHMPVYQKGRPPFLFREGGWAVDDEGNPLLQTHEEANFVLTIPRAEIPANGFPIVVFSRTGGGGERPLVDRGPRAEPGGDPMEPGTGPAMMFARAGFAGASIDGPHGGLRNVTGADEQFLVFNILNPLAMRDNIRQSALEIILAAHLLEEIRLDTEDCPGVIQAEGDSVRFDPDSMAVMGHSMGATILQPVLAFEPRFRAAIMSGAGGSYLENLIYKESPVKVRPLAELILKYHRKGRELTEHDPAVSMVQWAGEPADPPVYNRLISEWPPELPGPHVLMLQGIVDTYILPPIANATSLSLGLDMAGDSLDAEHPDLQHFRPLEELLSFSGREKIEFPVQGNLSPEPGTERTAVVVQHPGDGIEDGHETVFQTDPPKYQYRCFLESLVTGIPRVPAPGGLDDACE